MATKSTCKTKLYNVYNRKQFKIGPCTGLFRYRPINKLYSVAVVVLLLRKVWWYSEPSVRPLSHYRKFLLKVPFIILSHVCLTVPACTLHVAPHQRLLSNETFKRYFLVWSRGVTYVCVLVDSRGRWTLLDRASEFRLQSPHHIAPLWRYQHKLRNLPVCTDSQQHHNNADQSPQSFTG